MSKIVFSSVFERRERERRERERESKRNLRLFFRFSVNGRFKFCIHDRRKLGLFFEKRSAFLRIHKKKTF